MPNGVIVENLSGVSIEQQNVEIVERKGKGHPDYIADAIAETFSRNLSRYYLENFGSVLHHNVDKLEVIGGQTEPAFGGGKILEPIAILFSGRATDTYEGRRIPVRDIALDSANTWISENLRFVDPASIRYLFETKSGSATLASIYGRGELLSNDTSFGSGYAPLSYTEQMVMRIEKLLNSSEFKRSHEFSGEDVKVMAVRNRKKVTITVADAMVDRYIESLADYFDKKADLFDAIDEELIEFLPDDFSFKLGINWMDNRITDMDGCYLTVTGTSAEHGDDGSAGRGNRANGLITPNRTMSFEATAGKNPVNHIGKLYNILAFQMADEIFRQTGKEVSVKIAGRIGDPVDKPEMVAIQAWPRPTEKERAEIISIAYDMISSISGITEKLLSGELEIF